MASPVACPECGSVLEGLVPASDLELYQAEHTEDLRALASMKRKLEDASPDVTKQDLEVFHAWCVATGRDPATEKFGEGRHKAIRRMRRCRPPYKQPELLLALETVRKYPFVVYGQRRENGSASDLKTDLIDVFKDEKAIDMLLALADEDQGRSRDPLDEIRAGSDREKPA